MTASTGPRRRATVLLAAPIALVLALSACSGGADEASPTPTPSAPSGVLAGSEHGLAVGSTEAVPFDASAVSQGPQATFTTPATSLVYDGKGNEDPAVAQVELTSLTEGSVEDLNLDESSLALVEGATLYYLSYKLSYVNGPVFTMPNFNSFALLAGDENVTDDISNFSAGNAECGTAYEVENFGAGASMETCTWFFVTAGNPAPTAVQWYSPAMLDAGLTPVTWPIG